jgi:hypothetical protein
MGDYNDMTREEFQIEIARMEVQRKDLCQKRKPMRACIARSKNKFDAFLNANDPTVKMWGPAEYSYLHTIHQKLVEVTDEIFDFDTRRTWSILASWTTNHSSST